MKRHEDDESEVTVSVDNETGTERRERQDAAEQAVALRDLMWWFGWLAIVVSVILGVVVFCLVWNRQVHDGLIWVSLTGLFVAAAVAGVCWQRRRDLRRQVNEC